MANCVLDGVARQAEAPPCFNTKAVRQAMSTASTTGDRSASEGDGDDQHGGHSDKTTMPPEAVMRGVGDATRKAPAGVVGEAFGQHPAPVQEHPALRQDPEYVPRNPADSQLALLTMPRHRLASKKRQASEHREQAANLNVDEVAALARLAVANAKRVRGEPVDIDNTEAYNGS